MCHVIAKDIKNQRKMHMVYPIRDISLRYASLRREYSFVYVN